VKLLEGKSALVCGVANAKSIAWGIARELQAHGADVGLTCVESARRRVTRLAAEQGLHKVFACDVTQDEDVERVFGEIGPAFGGRLDVLVHSIAYARLEDLGGEFLTVDRAGWRTALEVSAYSLVALARAARPLMIAAGQGSIIALTFAGSEKVVPSYNVMGVAKAALECSVRYLAYDLGPDRIRVNALSPGPIETMSSVVVDRFQDSLEIARRNSPLLACVTPEDVGQAVAFYGSDLSRKVTGSVLHIDGGTNILCPSAKAHPRALVPAEETPAELATT
jgi:enoyl-[acyl-carrier protein] reductase I